MGLHLSTEAATQAWDDLAQRLERFIASWDAGQEPALTEFLPADPPAHRRFVLIELIKVDLEQRTTKGREKRLEDYAASFPEMLEDGEPPCDLIYEEYHIRRTAGHSVTASDYYKRFPKSASSLRRLMGTEDLSSTTQLFNPGRLEGFVAGKKLDDFDLLVELGKGAFGSVFLARQISMQRLVALKVSADKGNESQTLAALDHPNIIRVFDQRRLPDQRVRLLYMQFAPGGTLADVVKLVRETPPAARMGAILAAAVGVAVSKTGGIANEDAGWKRRLAAATWPETVCRLGVQLAQALDHAHKQGVLHRDVKPANVLLAADGSPKLADFNISFCSQLEGATPAAYFGGSLAYMSPEQLDACNPSNDCKAEDLDGRSDLYALAVVLWELLHGERPFADEEMTGSWTRMLEEMAKRRRKDEPYSPLPARDPVSIRLEQVLRKALSPAPGDRQPDGGTFARELLLCLNPRAWDLVNDLKSGWRNLARRRPTFALVPVNLPPFLLAAAFNYFFNYQQYILKHAGEPAGSAIDVVKAFHMIRFPVNLILFPLGVFLVLSYVWPVTAALRSLTGGQPVDSEKLRLARRRSLNLGHWIAGVGLILWLIAGVAFPAGIQALTGAFRPFDWVHFLTSMTLCGFVSCCFPFLATTWLTVRVFFPALLASTAPEVNEQRQLMALSRQAGRYVVIAAVVPMLAALLMLITSPENRAYTMIAIFAGVLGFGAAYYMYQLIRTDLAALSVVARPTDMIGTITDTSDTF
jgi:serine/threonine protein kinase